LVTLHQQSLNYKYFNFQHETMYDMTVLNMREFNENLLPF